MKICFRVVVKELCSVCLAGMLSLDAIACSKSVRIVVDSQADFDRIGDEIDYYLSEGNKDIDVYLNPGTYMYHTRHITIEGIDSPTVRITIRGNRAILVSNGEDFSSTTSARYVAGSGYIDKDLADVNNFSKMYQMIDLVEVVDFEKKICRVPCPEEMKNRTDLDWSCAKLELTSWYTSYSYDIIDIKSGYIYFNAYNLAKGLSHYGDYNVNYDFTVGECYPRFRIVNMPVGGCQIASEKKRLVLTGNSVVHQCEASRFLTVSDSKLKSINVQGIRFVGSNRLYSLISFSNVEAESLNVKNCSFSCMRSIVVYAKASHNLIVERCGFYDCYTHVIQVDNSADNAVIRNNLFYSIGKGLTQSFCVVCRGGNYEISHNEMYDFNYGAIGVGVIYEDRESTRPSYGVVKKNHIYYTEAYRKDKASWTLIDSGAIYLWTRNDGAVICNNYIHDYTGMGSNRGIYCDDGTINCSVNNNIVMNIENSYGIDLRKALILDANKMGRSNVNNTMHDNVFNNRYRFEGRGDDSSSVKGRNFVVAEGDNGPTIVLNALVETEEDEIVHYTPKQIERIAKKMLRRK